jgi:hypothetical protein
MNRGEVYKKLFNLVYENYRFERRDNPKVKQVESCLESILFEKEIKVEAPESQINTLFAIQNEIQRIINQNLKHNYEELNRNNSDVVLIERDEFIVASPRRKSRSKTSDIIELINASLRKLADLTKPPEHSSI